MVRFILKVRGIAMTSPGMPTNPVEQMITRDFECQDLEELIDDGLAIGIYGHAHVEVIGACLVKNAPIGNGAGD